MRSYYVKTKPKNVFNVSSIVTIHYYEFGPGFDFAGEKHGFWEMVYVDKGVVQIRRDEETLSLKQGEILFHAPNEFHSIRALDSAPNFFVVSFNCKSPSMARFRMYKTVLDKTLKIYLSSIIREAEKTYIIPKNDPDLKRLESRADAPVGGEQLIKTYLEQILIFLLRLMTTASPQSFPQKEAETDPFAEGVRKYLVEHLREPFRVSDLCRKFNYSRSYLCRRFRSLTGHTIADYYVDLRIDEAKRLIRETGMNISQISAYLAFDNPQYFARVFKKKTGMTPTEFKNRAHV